MTIHIRYINLEKGRKKKTTDLTDNMGMGQVCRRYTDVLEKNCLVGSG